MLFVSETGRSERCIPCYELAPPAGVPIGQHSPATEATELIGSTLRMRPGTPRADLACVGIVRAKQQIYPYQWILGLGWDQDGGAALFDRKDFQMLTKVNEAFSSYSDFAPLPFDKGRRPSPMWPRHVRFGRVQTSNSTPPHSTTASFL